VDAESEGRFDAILTSLLTRTWKHTLSSLEGRSCDLWHLLNLAIVHLGCAFLSALLFICPSCGSLSITVV